MQEVKRRGDVATEGRGGCPVLRAADLGAVPPTV
jgi:hypothetical protein